MEEENKKRQDDELNGQMSMFDIQSNKKIEIQQMNLARIPDEDFITTETIKQKPTIDGILKMLEKCASRYGRHELLQDIFELSALAVSNQFCFVKKIHDEREEQYRNIIQKYEKETQKIISSIFSEIFVLLTKQIDPNIGFNDYLGELYMRSETSNSRAGQFFTPYHVSRLCAISSLDESVILDAIENDKIITVNEPACGSGGMIIAVVDELYNRYHFNISRNLFVECSDIDSRCVHMAYLQIGLAGIPAVIYQRDTLTMKTWQKWETPAYVMQHMRFPC